MQYSNYMKTAGALALFLFVVVVGVFPQAYLTEEAATAIKIAPEPVGELNVEGDLSILVDGEEATSGQAIPSGARLQTPAGVRAIVRLGRVGKIHIAPETSLTLSYGSDTLDASLVTGCVIVATYKGASGAATTPPGTVRRTDPATDSFTTACAGRCADEAQTAPPTARAQGAQTPPPSSQARDDGEVYCKKRCSRLFGMACFLYDLDSTKKIPIIPAVGTGIYIITRTEASPMKP